MSANKQVLSTIDRLLGVLIDANEAAQTDPVCVASIQAAQANLMILNQRLSILDESDVVASGMRMYN